LASGGISKSIDMAFPHFGFLMDDLAEWHNAATRQRQRQTKFEAAQCVVPRACEVPSMPQRQLSTALPVFTGSSAFADDDKGASHA
jgi:hypothetical protein